MHVYTPSAVALTTITVPDDGVDQRKVSTINGPMQALADGVAFLNAQTGPLANLTALGAIAAPSDGTVRHVLGFGLYVFKTSATTGLFPFRVAATDATAGGWVASVAFETTKTVVAPCSGMRAITSTAGAKATVAPTAINFTWQPIAAADSQFDPGGSFNPLSAFTGVTNHYGYMLPLDPYLIQGATLSAATLRMQPNSGHAALPARLPKVALVRVASTFVLAALLSTGSGYAVDASATLVAYELKHTIVFTPDQNATIDKTQNSYFAIVLDEAGTNALAGGAYLHFALDFIAIPDARRS